VHPHFITKAFDQAIVARGFVGKKFQSDTLAERQIIRAVDLAHAAFSEQGDDAVARRHQPPRKKSTFVQRIFGGTGGPRRGRRRRSRRQR
jgi:hypothetical protein